MSHLKRKLFQLTNLALTSLLWLVFNLLKIYIILSDNDVLTRCLIELELKAQCRQFFIMDINNGDMQIYWAKERNIDNIYIFF